MKVILIYVDLKLQGYVIEVNQVWWNKELN